MTDKNLLYQSLQDKIHAAEFSTLFNRYPTLKTLSLDCFDTLLWRKTATPNDVFYKLQNQPHFKAIGMSAQLRKQMEIKARQMMLLREQHSEVNLHHIYQAFNHALSSAQLNALTEEELLIEMEICYAFPPTIELIRQAYNRNINIILVSDTYFSEQQLRRLLSHALPEDVTAMIKTIFCSSEYKRSKLNGLFGEVIRTQGTHELLHIGDHLQADYIAPRSLKLNALHLVREAESVADIMRLRAISAAIIDTKIRSTRPLFDVFHGVLAQARHLTEPHCIIGYASLGPLMYVFAQFITAEIEKLQQQGKNAKIIFLMRDAYLPSLTCEALTGNKIGHNVSISRFSALAASFQCESDVEEYLISIGKSNRYHDIARQLLLPLKVVEPLIKIAERNQEPEMEFFRLLRRKDVLKIIFNKSAEYRERLIHYLKKEIDLKPGDTLMFIDLGYSGTVQRLMTPLFQKMNVQVLGRYFIALRTTDTENDKLGLMDPSWCDDRVLSMVVNYIAILEQLCTANEKSVIDYNKSGEPVYSDVSMNNQQQSRLTQIQKECVRFINDAKNFFSSPYTATTWEDSRDYAVSELARMIHLPTKAELQYLQAFQFDLNMGTKDIYRLFDPAQGLSDLKRRGLFYMENNAQSKRTNYPAELRTTGFEVAFTSMIQNRLSLDFKIKDMLPRQQSLPAILSDNGNTNRVELDAIATVDGYFSVWAPAGTYITFLLGEKFQWLQLESTELIPIQAFIQQSESQQVIDARSYISYTGMTDKKSGLFECQSNAKLTMTSPLDLRNQEFVFRLVFRPIVIQSLDQYTGFKVTL